MASQIMRLSLAIYVLILPFMTGCASTTQVETQKGASTPIITSEAENLESQQIEETPRVSTPEESEEKEIVEMTDQVMAQVILRAADGSSILDSQEPITAENIAKYQVGQVVIEEVSQKLEKLGFEVLQASPTGLTISGDKALFEKVFQTNLEARGAEVMSSKIEGAEIAYYEATKPFKIPADLSSLIADVTLSTPPQFFP